MNPSSMPSNQPDSPSSNSGNSDTRAAARKRESRSTCTQNGLSRIPDGWLERSLREKLEEVARQQGLPLNVATRRAVALYVEHHLTERPPSHLNKPARSTPRKRTVIGADCAQDLL